MFFEGRVRNAIRFILPYAGLYARSSGSRSPTSRPQFLLLVSDAYIAQQLLICIREYGASAIIVDFSGSTALRWSRACRAYRTLGATLIGEPGKVAAALLEDAIGDERRPVSIVAAGMDATLFVARAKPFLTRHSTFPLMDEATLRGLNDKWRFASLCEELGIPHPKTKLLSPGDYTVPDWYSGQSVILKPLAQSGGRGVCRIDTEDHLQKAIGQAEADQTGLIVQEFISGGDGVLSILAHDGQVRALTIHVYESGGNSAIFLNRPELVSIAERIAARRKLNGVFEFDLLHQKSSDRFWILECNPRFWASVALSLFAGVNFLRLGSDQPADKLAAEPMAIPQAEWMRACELIARLYKGTLRITRIPPATLRSLYWNFSDPGLQLQRRPRSSSDLQ